MEEPYAASEAGTPADGTKHTADKRCDNSSLHPPGKKKDDERSRCMHVCPVVQKEPEMLLIAT